MRTAVLGDIHANWDALAAVLKDIDSRKVDRIYSVGDVVGYGAEPKKCIQELRDRNIASVAGNHDHAAIGRLDIQYFNPHARTAVEWTRRRLPISQAEYLSGLPLLTDIGDAVIAHGTVHQPEKFGYIETVFAAQLSFHAMNAPLAFLGHSHVPITFLENEGQGSVTYTQSTEIELRHVSKAIVNVGSVGQPRDDDPRACYVVHDSTEKKVEFYRIEYNIESAQAKIRQAGLPDVLAARLALGR